MRTNIVLNPALVTEAFRYAGVKTKKDLIDLALREFVRQHKRADVRSLRGKGLIDPTYNYRSAREENRMILVDTSIWIDFLSSRPGPGARRLDEIIADDLPFALTPIILQEILQGARSDREFRRLRANLITQRFLYPSDPTESHIAAAHLYVRCRQRGVTPRSAIDCLIAQIAIEHQASLLHNDVDFDHLAHIVPELRIYTPSV